MAYQICTRCVMDNASDPTIKFYDDGTCSYCNYALERKDKVYFPNEVGEQKLAELIRDIKYKGAGKKFDCLMGISGGLDSTYLAYLGNKWGLRVLAVHIDDGFDIEIAKNNINKIANLPNIEMMIEKPNKEQFVDLTKSFIYAGVPNIAIPQDNVLLAVLYKYALKYNLKYFLSGANFSLESILQRGNTHNAFDKVHILDIHSKYGTKSLDKLPLLNYFDRYIKFKYQHKVQFVRPLDLIKYEKDSSIEELEREIGFQYYGGKHYESSFTKFAQTYYLPKKFNVDKRRSHLSSLIISEQITRNKAIEELKKSLYDEEKMKNEIEVLTSQLGFKPNELSNLINQKGHSHNQYKTSFYSRFSALARKMRNVLSD